VKAEPISAQLTVEAADNELCLVVGQSPAVRTPLEKP